MDYLWGPKWDWPIAIVLGIFLVLIWAIAATNPFMWRTALRDIGQENFDRVDKPPLISLYCGWTDQWVAFMTTFRRKNSTTSHVGCIYWDFSERKWILVPYDDD